MTSDTSTSGDSSDSDDQLAIAAEVYEQTLSEGSTVEDEFEARNMGLARTLRMLNAVFALDQTLTLPGVGRSAEDLIQIGRFVISERLGSGNYGTVWLAQDPVLKRQVAIKVAHIGVHARPDLRQRFEREAHLAARLHHPGIVPVFEFGVDDDRLYIVSEYCSGDTLAQWLAEQESQTDPPVAARLLRSIADAAGHAHQQGLIHRDIKPANVLLEPVDSRSDDGLTGHTIPHPDSPPTQPKLTDFGLARDFTDSESVTRSGVMLGTVRYMSPEQAAGQIDSQGPPTDVFSLGVILYRLLTGQFPFTGVTELQTIQQITGSDPPAPHRIVRTIPRDLSSICMKCLEKAPARRYGTANELRDDLDSFLRGEATVARPISPTETATRWATRNPALAGLVAVCCLALVGAVAGMAWHVGQVKDHANQLKIALDDAHTQQAAAELAKQEADQQRHAADDQRRIAQDAGYRSDMRLAFDLWQRREVLQVRDLLQNHVPRNQPDLRGPEWYVLNAHLQAGYQQLGQFDSAVTECVLSPDQQKLYTAGTDGRVQVWDLDSGSIVTAYKVSVPGIHALALSPDGKELAIGGSVSILGVSQVVVVNPATGAEIRRLQFHPTTIESIAWSPDGRWLAAGGRYNPVQFTRLSDGQLFSLPVTRRNRAIAFSSDGRLFSRAAEMGHFSLSKVDSDVPMPLRDIAFSEGDSVYLSTFCPDSSLLATSYEDTHFILMSDAESGQRIAVTRKMPGHSLASTWNCLQFTPNARKLVAGNKTGHIVVWNAPQALADTAEEKWASPSSSIRPLLAHKSHNGPVNSIALTSDDRIISAGEDGQVVVSAPLASGATRLQWNDSRLNASLSIGDHLILGFEDGTVRSLDLNSPDRTRQLTSRHVSDHTIDQPATDQLFQHAYPVSSLACLSGQSRLAVGTQGGGVHLYDQTTGQLISTPIRDTPDEIDVAINGLAFSPQGRYLACVGERGLLQVLDTRSGEKVFSKTIGNTVYCVSFLHDENTIACGGRFEDIKIFNLATRQQIRSIPGLDTSAIATTPDGRCIVSAHLDGSQQITRLIDDGQQQVQADLHAFGASTCISPDRRRAISTDVSGYLLFTDLDSGSPLGNLTVPASVDSRQVLTVHCTDRFLVVTARLRNAASSSIHVWPLTDPGHPAPARK